MSANIFISFASQDAKIASTICAAIESRGFKCWISSRDILPGENFQSSIVRAIRSAQILLLVFTANSNRSDEMTKELALASQQKLMVVPLRVEDVTPSDAFAYEFATRQWIDLFSDWEQAMNQLCARMGAALATVPAPTDTIILGVPGAQSAAVKSAPALAVPAPKAKASRQSAPTAATPATRPRSQLLKVAAAAVVLIAVAAVATPMLLGKGPANAGTAASAATTLAPQPLADQPAMVVATAPVPAAPLPAQPEAAAPAVPAIAAPAAVAAPAATEPAAPVARDLPKLEQKKRVARRPSSNVPY